MQFTKDLVFVMKCAACVVLFIFLLIPKIEPKLVKYMNFLGCAVSCITDRFFYIAYILWKLLFIVCEKFCCYKKCLHRIFESIIIIIYAHGIHIYFLEKYIIVEVLYLHICTIPHLIHQNNIFEFVPHQDSLR
jgi:hypothetical protein